MHLPIRDRKFVMNRRANCPAVFYCKKIQLSEK